MKKNDVFTFTAPNGVEVTAVVIARVAHEVNYKWATERFVCYAQNRLFTYEESHCIWEFMKEEPKSKYGEVIVDYAILPDYDKMLEAHQAMDYPIWEQNIEKPDPDEGEDIFWDSCAEEHNKQEDV